MIHRNDLGAINSIEWIEQSVSLDQKFVIDVGCGAMGFTKQLVGLGAKVLAVDPDPVQAELNRNADPISNLEFIESGAEKIPVADDLVDGVFFCFSLHHVPESAYPSVFAEVKRVLRPDGFLCVIEPIGSELNEVMKLFHDEDRERAAAQDAIEEQLVPMFKKAKAVEFHSFVQYESFDDFAHQFASKSFNTLYSAEQVRAERVREAFEAHRPDYRFRSPKMGILLEGLRK